MKFLCRWTLAAPGKEWSNDLVFVQFRKIHGVPLRRQYFEPSELFRPAICADPQKCFISSKTPE
jgi:hypothetical protein